MKTYNFKYGHGSVSLSLNEADILAELHGTETPPISDIRSALFASLEQPIDSAPLRQRVHNMYNKDSNYISIGEMAKINRTTIPTLKLYDSMGLLTPYYVDEHSHIATI